MKAWLLWLVAGTSCSEIVASNLNYEAAVVSSLSYLPPFSPLSDYGGSKLLQIASLPTQDDRCKALSTDN